MVQATENAANQIMGAAEAIGSWLQAGGDPAALPAVTEQVNTIFEACTFQDLTGQRIRRAIEHLQQVETMLSGMMHEAPVEPADAPSHPRPTSHRPTSTACSREPPPAISVISLLRTATANSS